MLAAWLGFVAFTALVIGAYHVALVCFVLAWVLSD